MFDLDSDQQEVDLADNNVFQVISRDTALRAETGKM
jgi:hypothetical protein